jgi:hypothetical protein
LELEDSMVTGRAGNPEATYLNQILSFSLGDERLELGRGEGVHKTGL